MSRLHRRGFGRDYGGFFSARLRNHNRPAGGAAGTQTGVKQGPVNRLVTAQLTLNGDAVQTFQ